MIEKEEILLARHCIRTCMEQGASHARVSLSKCVSDEINLVCGEVDKVVHQADRSIYLDLFVDGRYGAFSTNRLGGTELEEFVRKAVETVRLLAEDPFRKLPDLSVTAFGEALEGTEMGLYDPSYHEVDSSARVKSALRESVFNIPGTDLSGVISEELQYSDMLDDNYLIDSNGFEGRHLETSFNISCEITVEDSRGRKNSALWWERRPFLSELPEKVVAPKALERARAMMSPEEGMCGKLNLVVDSRCASRLVSPIIGALQANAIQQCNSFLSDTRGKQVFPECVTIVDRPREKGLYGARLFDSEGVATKERYIVDRGVVTDYFVNTYMSGKMGIPQTVEGISHIDMMPFISGSGQKEISLQDILGFCGNGILVTGFNGGNCNTATGNFSYGIEGFYFENGKMLHPVSEMLITGNIVELWNSVTAAGSDAYRYTAYSIPSLAFKNVDFSA